MNLHRHLLLAQYAASSLLRRGGRTATILAAYAVVVYLLASLLMVTGALRREAAALLSSSPELLIQRVQGGRHAPVPVSLAAEIAAIRGVAAVAPRVWGYHYDPPPDATYTFLGAETLPGEAGEMVEGSWEGPEAGERCVIGQGVARARDLEPGDLLPVRGPDGALIPLRVTGIFTSPSNLLTNDLVVMSPGAARRVLAVPEGMATDLAVSIPNDRETETVALKVLERFPDLRAIPRSQLLRTYDAVFSWRSGVWAAILLGAVLALALLAWDRATSLAGEERREIGILKALGWQVGEVLEARFWEGAILSLGASLTGIIAAFLSVSLWGAGLFRPVLMGWSTLYPDFPLPPALEPFQVGVILLGTVTPVLAATLIPSWRVAVMDPDAVIRE